MDSTQLFLALKNAGVRADADGPLWWPGAGTFEVVVGAVLTQNTNWKNVDKALNNLKNANLMSVGMSFMVQIPPVQSDGR